MTRRLVFAIAVLSSAAWATQAATPSFTLPAGPYAGIQTNGISSGDAGVHYCYSDGRITTMPSTDGPSGSGCGPNSALYIGTFPQMFSQTLYAVAGGGGFTDSAVVSATYTINAPGSVPATFFGNHKQTGSSPFPGSAGAAAPVVWYQLSSWENLNLINSVDGTDKTISQIQTTLQNASTGLVSKIQEAITNGMGTGTMSDVFSDIPSWLTANANDFTCNNQAGAIKQRCEPPAGPHGICTDVGTDQGIWSATHPGGYNAGDQVEYAPTTGVCSTDPTKCHPAYYLPSGSGITVAPPNSPWAVACTNTSGDDQKIKDYVHAFLTAQTAGGVQFRAYVKLYTPPWGYNVGNWWKYPSDADQSTSLTQLNRFQQDIWTQVHTDCPECGVGTAPGEGSSPSADNLNQIHNNSDAVLPYTDFIAIHGYCNNGDSTSPMWSVACFYTQIEILKNGINTTVTASGTTATVTVNQGSYPVFNASYIAENLPVTIDGTTNLTVVSVDTANNQITLSSTVSNGTHTITSQGLGAFSSKPILNTETSWGSGNSASIPGYFERADFAEAQNLIAASEGIQIEMQWGWDTAASGQEYISGTPTEDCTLTYGSGHECTAGLAIAALKTWLVGKTFTGPCTASSNVWTCSFTDGTKVVWSDLTYSYAVNLTKNSTVVPCQSGTCLSSHVPTAGTYVYMKSSGGSPVIACKVQSVDPSNTFLTLDTSSNSQNSSICGSGYSGGKSVTLSAASIVINGSNTLTVTVANTFHAGDSVTFSGLSSATFLNGQTVTVATSNGSQFTASFTHTSFSTTDSGEVDQTFVGQTMVWFPVGPSYAPMISYTPPAAYAHQTDAFGSKTSFGGKISFMPLLLTDPPSPNAIAPAGPVMN